MFKELNHIHFVGIGGAGMSAIAKILLQKGLAVSGSDIHSSPLIEKLRQAGATVYLDHKAVNIAGADAIVISTAIKADNPEVTAAQARNVKILHRSDIVAALMNEFKGIAIAGAHGKTTTTSMLSVVLDYAGLEPTIVIGGEVDYLGSNAKLGGGDYLVAEADESDGSFLKLLPHIAVVTNIENDHLDYYGTMDNVLKTFRKFLHNLDPQTGLAVLCFDNDNIRSIAEDFDRRYISYAIDRAADYTAKNIAVSGAHTSFDVYRRDLPLGRVTLNIPGRHNVLNALAAIAVALHVGLELPVISEGLERFNGAKRRFQTKGNVNGVWVVDDYAHHPTEINTTLRAAKQTNPHRLICVFQPHRYSRTQLLQKEFGSCFADADVLVLTDVYAAGEQPINGISGETIKREVENQTNRQVTYIADRSELAAYLSDFVKTGDLVMTMGAGDIYLTGEELLQDLNK